MVTPILVYLLIIYVLHAFYSQLNGYHRTWLLIFFAFWLVSSYQLRIESMLLCEETASLIDMLNPKVKLVEEACECKSTLRFLTVLSSLSSPVAYLNYFITKLTMYHIPQLSK